MPLWQVIPPVHALPHVPQWNGSVAGDAHAAWVVPIPQSVSPVGQAHWPPRQIWVERHAFPHPPQLRASVAGSAQVDVGPHISEPGIAVQSLQPNAGGNVPRGSQVESLVQPLWQPLQLSWSVAVSTHAD